MAMQETSKRSQAPRRLPTLADVLHAVPVIADALHVCDLLQLRLCAREYAVLARPFTALNCRGMTRLRSLARLSSMSTSTSTMDVDEHWLSRGLAVLDVSGCERLERLPEALPASLRTFDCRYCYKLQRLSEQLPPSLMTLVCRWCT